MILVVACGLLFTGPRLAAQAPAPGSPAGATLGAPLAQPPQLTSRGEEPTQGEERGEEEREEEPIETDRDAFTPATRTAGRNRFILESAYSFIDNRRVADTHSFPELLLRYGITERVELRLGWNYEVGGAGNEISGAQGDAVLEEGGSRIAREHRIAYGVKAALTEQSEWVPASAVILQGFTPTGGEATDTQLVATYVFGWELPNRWRADAAVRYATSSEGEDRFNIWAPSAVLRVPLGERWGVHAEYFGLFAQDRAEDFVRHYVSPGFRFLVTPNLEVGARVGWGLNDQSARFFSNVGVGWRF
jgi:hypothetical protein